jgi:tRNA nucleotidyltransferase (CCA-adding enzyme)
MTPRRAHELGERLAALPAARPLRAHLGERDDVYIVGGAIRDLLLGTTPLDLDLVVDGDLEPVIARLGGPDRAHDRFGTATVEIDGFSYDLARARRERYRYPGALPDVEPAGLAEDLRRRDFSVNALAAALIDGRLVAIPGALDDLTARRLRVLHDASFFDDPTRLLRLVRYGARLGFSAEPHTAELARAAIRGGALGTVSGSRIGGELRLLAGEPDPVAALRELHRWGIDEALEPGFGIRGPEDEERLRRGLALLPDDGDPTTLILAAALVDVGTDRQAPILERLAFTAARRDRILAAAGHSDGLARALAEAQRPSEIAAAVGGLPVEAVALAGANEARAPAQEWLERLRHIGLDIGGHDLIAAGLPRGPRIGAALARARAAKLDGAAQGREAELAAALRVPEGAGSLREDGHPRSVP